jgi:hypothetical protein
MQNIYDGSEYFQKKLLQKSNNNNDNNKSRHIFLSRHAVKRLQSITKNK